VRIIFLGCDVVERWRLLGTWHICIEKSILRPGGMFITTFLHVTVEENDGMDPNVSHLNWIPKAYAESPTGGECSCSLETQRVSSGC